MTARRFLAVVILAGLAELLRAGGGSAASGGFRLTAADFRDGGRIPAIHEGNGFGCSGRNVPPVFRWTATPRQTGSLALEMIDSDSNPPGFVHWIVYNIPASRHSLTATVLSTVSQGLDDAHVRGYFGPCPPPGSGTHHYHFMLYALNVPRLSSGALTMADFRRAMSGHTVGAAELVGTFSR